MKKNYLFSAVFLLGSVTIVAPKAEAEGWRNMNHLLPNVSRATGWSGVVTGGDGGRGVGEIFAGAGMVYQVVRDLPAGEYTLTANAFYRDGSAPESAARHFIGKENITGYLFINDKEVRVKSLFDKQGVTANNLISSTDGYIWGLVPNSCGEAADDFDKGHYLNIVKAQHPGGDMIIGYKCYGAPNTLVSGKLVTEDECNVWSMFGNFKLT
ncbi:MAG: hypothetical protein K2K97_07355, partial [Muribaculaceae bacterium]|nr:hypothetical protein [Muribaculaceae bacterium]